MLNKNTIVRFYVIAKQNLFGLLRRKFSPRNDENALWHREKHLPPRNDVEKLTIRPFNRSTFQPAFTLAEVLITLGTIGLIAMMTIPDLISNYQKEQVLSQLKKDYSSLVQAVKLSEIENGDNQYWDWGTNITVRQSFDTYWAPYLKIMKHCYTYSECGYTSTSPWKTLSGDPFGMGLIDAGTRTPVILSDGTLLMIRFVSSESSPAKIYLDINAGKGPNVLGKDFFIFIVDANKGFVPNGYNQIAGTLNNSCKIGSVGDFCAAKIIFDGWQIKSDYPW
ncbi:MAG: DUF6613 domain-containing protein [Candidatus Gastranaerophilaceae bacterium]